MGYFTDPYFDEEPEEWEERCERFAHPGGDSALHAASGSNPRNLPCPTCATPNVLTPRDRASGYQCDACARAAEGWGP